jgi:uncharacterized protein involved in type VI secretion and phage assembly
MNDRAIQQVLESQSGKYFGKYEGTVLANVDDEKRGRLKVTVSDIIAKEGAWATPCVPYAGPNLGFYTIPDVGSLVWVEFAGGEPNYPIWTGCFWKTGDIPAADAKPSIKFLRTKKFLLRIDDDTGEIVIENDSGTQIKLTAQDLTLKSATIKQEASAGRKIELSAAGVLVNDGALEVL